MDIVGSNSVFVFGGSRRNEKDLHFLDTNKMEWRELHVSNIRLTLTVTLLQLDVFIARMSLALRSCTYLVGRTIRVH